MLAEFGTCKSPVADRRQALVEGLCLVGSRENTGCGVRHLIGFNPMEEYLKGLRMRAAGFRGYRLRPGLAEPCIRLVPGEGSPMPRPYLPWAVVYDCFWYHCPCL